MIPVDPEQHPAGRRHLSHIIVGRTVASTGDWQLSMALARAVLALAPNQD